MQIQYVFLFYFRLKDTLQVVAVLVLHHRGGPARSHSQSLSALRLSEPLGRLGRGRRWPLSATVTEDAPVGAGHVILRWFLRL